MKSDSREGVQATTNSIAAVEKCNSKMQDHILNKHKDMLFACGLCQGSDGSIFESILETRNHVKNVHEFADEIVDKVIKLPNAKFLRSFKCVACPASAGYVFKITINKFTFLSSFHTIRTVSLGYRLNFNFVDFFTFSTLNFYQQ